MSYSETIDIHGETAESAQKKLLVKLKSLPKDTRELTIIHGYHSGQILLDTVRKFKHPRIERKLLGLNNGETIFLIKPPKF